MKNYFELIKKIAPLDRCHCGPEMRKAYELLASYYSGTRLLEYPCGEKINHWILPPAWQCNKATLKGPDGNIIANKARNHLEVFSYSPPIKAKISREELESHLLSDPERPDAKLFHFRNQYRHWSPEWGFSIPHLQREQLSEGTYEVEIDSAFSNDGVVTQAEMVHHGTKEQAYLFMGHFDHPFMVNDGLAGCVAAFELLKRLKGRKTRFTYRALASVEIVGSVAYLHHESDVRNHVKEGLFLGFSGIEAPLVYQTSFAGVSEIDRIVKYFFMLDGKGQDTILGHREVVGNDENVFDSSGIDIAMGTLCRWPFPEYHTDADNIEITKPERIEEMVSYGLRIIDVLERNRTVVPKFVGVPCLSNPDIDLYLSPAAVSGCFKRVDASHIQGEAALGFDESEYIRSNSHLLYGFMNNAIRMADGQHTIFDICERSRVPFLFGEAYFRLLEEKGLVELVE